MESIEHNKLIELFNLASNNYYYTIISLFSLLISIYLFRKLIKEKTQNFLISNFIIDSYFSNFYQDLMINLIL